MTTVSTSGCRARVTGAQRRRWSVRIVREHTFVSAEASILHADLDAFFASVEQRDDPRLRGQPGDRRRRGGAGGELRGQGVRRAHGDGRAARAAAVPAGDRRRRRASRPTSRRARRCSRSSSDTSPEVEGMSIDEAFLDVRGMRQIAGAPAEIAARLRRRVREQVGLPITVGVARTKFLAKVASGVAKPDGLLVVRARRASSRSCTRCRSSALWGVGPKTADKLHARGITTVGEVAELSETVLVALLGRAAGRHLHALAHNRDPRRGQVGRRRRSIGAQRALGRRGPRTPAGARRRAGRPRRSRRPPAARGAARRAGRSCCGCASTTSRARRGRTRCVQATAQTQRDPARRARAAGGRDADDPRAGHHARRPVADQPRRTRAPSSSRCPFDGHARCALDAAIDDVREKFGTKAITRAVLLGRDRGIEMPLLPD